MMLQDATSNAQVQDAIADFARENPELMEALETFGVVSAEYERALRALTPAVLYTSSSTQPR
jgi:hypothetical protein